MNHLKALANYEEALSYDIRVFSIAFLLFFQSRVSCLCNRVIPVFFNCVFRVFSIAFFLFFNRAFSFFLNRVFRVFLTLHEMFHSLVIISPD